MPLYQLVMTETAAAQHGLRPKLFMLSYACVGVPPHIMGVGPALAIPAALERAGLALDDIDGEPPPLSTHLHPTHPTPPSPRTSDVTHPTSQLRSV